MKSNKSKYLLNVEGRKYKAGNFLTLIFKVITKKSEKK